MTINFFRQLMSLELAREQDKIVHVETHGDNRMEHAGFPRHFVTEGEEITGYRITTIRGFELFVTLADGFYVHGLYDREYKEELNEFVYS